MISWTALVGALAITVVFVSVAFRERRRLKSMVVQLVEGIEARTADDDDLRPVRPRGDRKNELDELLDDALVRQDGPSALCAVHELESMARLFLVKSRDLGRAAGRVPFLTALAAAIVMVALGGGQRPVLIRAGACVGISLLGSVAAALLCRAAHSLARKFSDLCGELARQVESHWAVSQVSADVRPGLRSLGAGGDGAP